MFSSADHVLHLEGTHLLVPSHLHQIIRTDGLCHSFCSERNRQYWSPGKQWRSFQSNIWVYTLLQETDTGSNQVEQLYSNRVDKSATLKSHQEWHRLKNWSAEEFVYFLIDFENFSSLFWFAYEEFNTIVIKMHRIKVVVLIAELLPDGADKIIIFKIQDTEYLSKKFNI